MGEKKSPYWGGWGWGDKQSFFVPRVMGRCPKKTEAV